MDLSEHILVVLLSTALAVFLVVAIAVSIQVYKLVKAIQRITDKAEHVIQSAEHVSSAFANASGSMAVFKVIRNVVNLVNKEKAKAYKRSKD